MNSLHIKTVSILFLGLIMAVFVFSGCKTKEKNTTNYSKANSSKTNSKAAVSIEVISAEYQHWRAGTQEGGSGTEYYIEISSDNKESIVFEEVVVDGASLEAKLVVGRVLTPDKTLQPNAEGPIKVRAGSFIKTGSPKDPQSVKIKYTSGGKSRELVVKSLTKREEEARP